MALSADWQRPESLRIHYIAGEGTLRIPQELADKLATVLREIQAEKSRRAGQAQMDFAGSAFPWGIAKIFRRRLENRRRARLSSQTKQLST